MVWARSRAGFLFAIGTAPPTAPDDDDTKDGDGNTLTITARLDCEGYHLRPPRGTLVHAVNDGRNSALVGPDRLEMDAHEAKSLREGRLPNVGVLARVQLFTTRAGDALGLDEFIVEYEEDFTEGRLDDNTDSGDDCDGYKMVVDSSRVYHALDSGLNADLKTVGTDQDAHETIHAVDPARSTGQRLRVAAAAFRAGQVMCPQEIVVEYEEVGEEPVRAKET